MNRLDLLEGFEGIKKENANIIFSVLLIVVVYILINKHF
jgi:hypothetical protein